MKDMELIEELLNSYIDGELDERKNNEVKRLIDNDKQIRRLFDSLSRYKKLMGAVASDKAPEGFCESVTKHLERHILLADTGEYRVQRVSNGVMAAPCVNGINRSCPLFR